MTLRLPNFHPVEVADAVGSKAPGAAQIPTQGYHQQE